MSESFAGKDTGELLDLGPPDTGMEPENEAVSSRTAFEEPTKEPEETTPSSEDIPEEKVEEKSSGVEDLPSSPAESDEKPATTSSKELTSCPAKWLEEHGVDQRVIDLIYWRNLKKTGVVFATVMVVLLSLTCYTLLSVVTFFSMALLTVALLYRVGMTVMGAIQKSGTDNPFKNVLEKDVEIPKEKAVEIAEAGIEHINCLTKQLRRLFLVEDIVDSIKFGLLLWVLSYVGAWFSALTLIIIDVVALFSLPKLYEDHQDKVDEYLSLARTQVASLVEQAKSKLPAKFQKEKSS